MFISVFTRRVINFQNNFYLNQGYHKLITAKFKLGIVNSITVFFFIDISKSNFYGIHQ